MVRTDIDRHTHDRVIFVCERGELRHNNMCRFGGMWLAQDAQERDRVTGPLGPDAAGISSEDFAALLAHRRGSIKAALIWTWPLGGVRAQRVAPLRPSPPRRTVADSRAR
ncbi:MAG TPA: hypothetical protein VFB39_18185 [Solirubrobacteraceae bacterium]|nr:hypothetical protein [Solirubrobacteraceae bacterium]